MFPRFNIFWIHLHCCVMKLPVASGLSGLPIQSIRRLLHGKTGINFRSSDIPESDFIIINIRNQVGDDFYVHIPLIFGPFDVLAKVRLVFDCIMHQQI